MKKVKVIDKSKKFNNPRHERAKKLILSSTYGAFGKQERRRWEQSLYEPIER